MQAHIGETLIVNSNLDWQQLDVLRVEEYLVAIKGNTLANYYPNIPNEWFPQKLFKAPKVRLCI